MSLTTLQTVQYVFERGATIHKVDQRLAVKIKGKVVREILLHQLEQLIVSPEVQLTGQASAFLMDAGIEVAYMRNNRFVGRLVGDDGRNVELRVAQMDLMRDPVRALMLARAMIGGKIANQLALLEKAGRNARRALPAGRGGGQGRAFVGAIEGLRQMLGGAINADSVDALMGYEGRAAAWYWPAFGGLLANPMGFAQRQFHPSLDPVNALLSFGYALLQKDVQAAVHGVGLDPYLSCLHAIQNNRPSLVLDLMEEFRPVLVDGMVLRLINLGQIKETDFTRDAKNDKRPLSLAPRALRAVIEAYETRASGPALYRLTGETTPLRRCIELQARQIAQMARGELNRYEPFLSESV